MRKFIGSNLKYAILILFALFAIAPIIMVWISSLKSSSEIFQDPFALPKVLRWGNLVQAWVVGHFSKYILNSFIVTLPTVFFVLSLSCAAGYAFAKLKFAGSRIFFYTFLLGLMIPFQAIMIPLYYMEVNLKLIGTYWAMILPATALGLPFGIFFMQAFFRNLPPELMDAARIDGCNEVSVFFKIMLPLTAPAVSSLFVLQFMWTWNAFLMPLLLLNKDSLRPIMLGLMFFSGTHTINYALVAAGETIVTLPTMIVFLFFQRQFMRGLTAGAIKG